VVGNDGAVFAPPCFELRRREQGMRRVKSLVFIEHDIIIRHFVHSRAFCDLAARHELKFVFPQPGYKRVRLDVAEQGLCAPYRHMTVHEARLGIWKKLLILDQMRWRSGRHFAVMRHFRRQAIGSKATAIYAPLAVPGLHRLARRWFMARLAGMPNRELDALLDEERPDVIIHPCVLDGAFLNDLTVAAKDRGTPFVVIMNSWDNPSTKQAMAGWPDYLLVWGEQTRRHAIDFIGMPSDRVIPFGAAQFEVYRSAPSVSREEFCRVHGINPSNRILLYAGSSKETNEFEHLVAIDEAAAAGRLGHTSVVYRPHPWGQGGRGGERILGYPWKNVRIESSMRGYLERVRAGEKDPSYPDYRHTHDVLSSVDAVVSPLSTILLEAALHGKPALCFLPDDEREAGHFQLAAPMIHFEGMYAMPEFLKARGRAELLPQLESLLSVVGDAGFAARLKEACAYFVESRDTPYGERLVRFIEETILRPGQAGAQRKFVRNVA
jgi:hypothetical protein